MSNYIELCKYRFMALKRYIRSKLFRKKVYDSDVRHFHLLGAEAGDSEKMCSYGLNCVYGYGGPVDIECGIFWLEKAANSGVVEASFILGILYINGECLKTDFVQSEKWLNAAANKGHSSAQYTLALECMEGGRFKADELRGMKWMTTAATNGDESAIKFCENLIETKK